MANKTWFITGASSGFGQAFAEHALTSGDHVVAAARSPEKLNALVDLAPDRVLTVRLDVNNRDHLAPAVEATLKRFGRIDVLVNNAGYGIVGAAEETPEERPWLAVAPIDVVDLGLERRAGGLGRAMLRLRNKSSPPGDSRPLTLLVPHLPGLNHNQCSTRYVVK